MNDKDPLDGMVAQVLNQLAQRGDESSKDIYAWNDGTVTGPRDNSDSRVSDLRVVGLFTAAERPTEREVRETLARGMREANSSDGAARR